MTPTTPAASTVCVQITEKAIGWPQGEKKKNVSACIFSMQAIKMVNNLSIIKYYLCTVTVLSGELMSSAMVYGTSFYWHQIPWASMNVNDQAPILPHSVIRKFMWPHLNCLQGLHIFLSKEDKAIFYYTENTTLY